MTHSPTPTELLALRTANAALLNSPDSFCDMVSTVVFALGSAQLLQSPETAAELSRLRSDHVEDAAQFAEFRELFVKLRARVAELETERSSLVAARDAQIIAWLGKKAGEYGTSNRESRAKAEAVSRMADKLSRGAVRPARPVEAAAVRPCGCPARFDRHADGCPTTAAEDVTPQVRRLRDLLAGQRAAVEDPHDSPLHHTYRLGHDLPETRNA